MKIDSSDWILQFLIFQAWSTDVVNLIPKYFLSKFEKETYEQEAECERALFQIFKYAKQNQEDQKLLPNSSFETTPSGLPTPPLNVRKGGKRKVNEELPWIVGSNNYFNQINNVHIKKEQEEEQKLERKKQRELKAKSKEQAKQNKGTKRKSESKVRTTKRSKLNQDKENNNCI